MTINLKVCACPSKDLAYDNHIFISKIDANKLFTSTTSSTKYISIKNSTSNLYPIVYPYKIHKNIEPNSIGLTMFMRQSCKSDTGSLVSVKEFNLDNDKNYNLVYLKIYIHYLHGFIEIEEEELLIKISEKLNQFIVSTGAIYIFDISGNGAISVKVIELKIADIPNNQEKLSINEYMLIVNHGLINKHTTFDYDYNSNHKMLNIIKSKGQNINLFGPKWEYNSMGIGGLDVEFTNIFRRAFASRTLPSSLVKKLGIEHVRGLLLFGPPGTGKTLIARQIGKMLHGKEPKLVNGPEILNKYVGQSEENIRLLFEDAESDQEINGDNSDLHIIIFDEIDAICKKRGSTSGNTGVHDTVVNQLLSKMDGVDSLNNILVIGMTNRKDMIDGALLRPGRFEVHVEIGLPDKNGRVEIFKIHTKIMRENGFLHKDIDFDLLSDLTKNFSGAEIAGLVKSATSFAYYGNLDIHDADISLKNVEEIKINMAHFVSALSEVTPAFGISEENLKLHVRNGIIEYGSNFIDLYSTCTKLISQVKNSEKTSLLSLLLEGQSGSGMTAVAVSLAIKSGFPFIKLISPEDFIGWSDFNKCADINKTFEDAYKSPLSLLILDNIERLLGYVDIGPRFSNLTLQTILVLLKKIPPIDAKLNKPRKLLIIGTTSNKEILNSMSIFETFMVSLNIKPIFFTEDIKKVFQAVKANIDEENLEKISENISNYPIGIKTLLMIIEMASQNNKDRIITYKVFNKCAKDCGVEVENDQL